MCEKDVLTLCPCLWLLCRGQIIERRWVKEEIHLYTLGFVLHPHFYHCALALLQDSKTHHGNYTTNRNRFSQGRLKLAAEFYFKKFSLESRPGKEDEEARSVGQQLLCWLNQSALEACNVP